ncbi:HNH endonuclease [Streptomyces sp. NPDC056188]|uniref:HNH endonuclease n=1 Tax=Streptomyces sp. NPDC056188 TaxID=3345740 RepID=UPI0035D81F8D
MPRIRTVKPEFWEDEVVGLLPRDARLLFISTFNMADDEGLLRWTPSYIKANTFMYDDDISVGRTQELMQALTSAGLIFPYVGGVARQQMAMIVNFRKHQKINRPQKSKLPPPSLQNGDVRRVYARRDGWTCQLCGEEIPKVPVSNDSHNLSIDHIRHQSNGGTDHPSNLRATHQACNKSRRDRPDGDEFVPPSSMATLDRSLHEAMNRSVNMHGSELNDSRPHSVNESHAPSMTGGASFAGSDFSSLNDSRNDSLQERKGKEGNREGKGTPPTPRQSSGSPAVVQTGERAVEDRMTDAFLDRYARGNSYKRRQVRPVVADALANDTDPGELWRALEQLGETSKPITANTLQFAFSKIRGSYQPANVYQLPTGQTLSGTDAKVAGWMAIAEQLRQEGDPA